VYVGSTFGGVEIIPAPGIGPDLLLLRPTKAHEPLSTCCSRVRQHFADRTCGVLPDRSGYRRCEGLAKIKEKGGLTIAQDQDCCVYPNVGEKTLCNAEG